MSLKLILLLLVTSTLAVTFSCCSERYRYATLDPWVIYISTPDSDTPIMYHYNSTFRGDCKFVGQLTPVGPNYPSFSLKMTSSCPTNLLLELSSLSSPTPFDIQIPLKFHEFSGLFHTKFTTSSGAEIAALLLGDSKLVITTTVGSEIYTVYGDRILKPLFPYSKKRMVIPWIIFVIVVIGVTRLLKVLQNRSELRQSQAVSEPVDLDKID
ncbi:hypothetical protein RCL1_003186 [Eukaryota sp. TZLM3-RCL]